MHVEPLAGTVMMVCELGLQVVTSAVAGAAELGEDTSLQVTSVWPQNVEYQSAVWPSCA
jgi:hypothetical protein